MSERRLQRKLEQESRLPALDRKTVRPERFSFTRSGWLTASILLVTLLAPGFVWRAHQRASFHQMTTDAPLPVATVPLPGGQEAAVLTRLVLLHNTVPEFVSATVLPGVGMQVLQLAVNVPKRGMRALFDAPSISEITANARPDGAPFHLTLSPAGRNIGSAVDVIAANGATNVANQTLADGGEVTGTFALADAAGAPLGVEAKVDTTLTGRSFEAEVRLRNKALTSHEFSLNWSPRLRAWDGNLSRFVLKVPSTNLLTDGSVRSVRSMALDFSAGQGKTVPNVDFDATYVELQRADIGEGPAVTVTDAQSGIVLRFVLLTPSIRTVRVRADSLAHTLMVSFSTDDGAKRTPLEAGESADMRVRVDVLPVGAGAKPSGL